MMPTASHTANRLPLPRRLHARPRRPTRPKLRRRAARWAGNEAASGVSYHDVALVLFVGAVCGLYYGLTANWQIAVESAQAVAGTVEYPADNPFYMYHVKSWTLLHQIPALLLAGGVSERVASMLIACTASVLCQQALGLISLAFSRDRWVSSVVPILYLATNVYKGCGVAYPIFIIPDSYWTSYGVTGTGFTLFVWSLWGLGLRRPAAVLCGLAPAVHPALGGWCVATTAVALAWNWRAERARLPMIGRWFALGAAISAVSFAVQQYLARGLPAADPALSRQLLEAFVEGWDNHRMPFPMASADCHFAWALLMLSSVAFVWFVRRLPRESRLLLRILLVSAVASLALCALTHVSRWLPLTLVMAMPGRFVNFAILAYPAVLIGLLARWRRLWSIDCLLAGLSAYCLMRSIMLSKQLFYVPGADKVFIACGLALVYVLASHKLAGAHPGLRRFVRGGALVCLLLAGIVWMRDLHLAALVWLAVPLLWTLRTRLGLISWPQIRPLLRSGTLACLWLAFLVKGGCCLAVGCLLAAALDRLALPFKWHRSERGLPRPSSNWRDGLGRPSSNPILLSMAAAGCLVLVMTPLIENAQARYRSFGRIEDDPVIVAARRQEGLLLTVPRMRLVQLHTRRPLLLNGEAMNQVTYVPASGPAMNDIVKRIYGDDMLAPRPPGWERCGGLMLYSGYQLWQQRGEAEWQQLAREFGFTNVLTPPEWNLALPVVARNDTMILYGIPGRRQ